MPRRQIRNPLNPTAQTNVRFADRDGQDLLVELADGSRHRFQGAADTHQHLMAHPDPDAFFASAIAGWYPSTRDDTTRTQQPTKPPPGPLTRLTRHHPAPPPIAVRIKRV